MERGTTVGIHWVLENMDVEGNEKTDEAAKEVMEKAGT